MVFYVILQNNSTIFLDRFNPQLDLITADPPKNPKKVLFEQFPAVKFSKGEVKENYVSVTVTVPFNGKDVK